VDYQQASAINAAIRAIGMRHRALAGALLGPLGLHPGQEVLLLELDAQGPRTQGQLAVACGCEPPTITNSVRRLEAAGLVVRRPSPNDGRATIVDLSERGRSLMPRLRTVWQRLGEQTVAEVTTTPLPELTDILLDLAASLAAQNNPASRSVASSRAV
jgi:DNA-binding MarR family transcriptional regulator